MTRRGKSRQCEMIAMFSCLQWKTPLLIVQSSICWMHVSLPTHLGKCSAICFSTWCKYLEMHYWWEYMKCCLQISGALTRRWSFIESLRWTPPLYHILTFLCSLPSALLPPAFQLQVCPTALHSTKTHRQTIFSLTTAWEHGMKTHAQVYVLHALLLLLAPPAALLPYVPMTHFSVSPNGTPIPLCPHFIPIGTEQCSVIKPTSAASHEGGCQLMASKE